MPKRRKPDSHSEESEFEHGSPGSDSDASFSTETRKTRVQSRKRGPTKRKKPESNVTVDIGFAALTWRHSRNTHVLQKVDKVRTALLAWYNVVRDSRGMPWRKPFDRGHGRGERAQRAYEVWVSEIMLQQTQVATVIPYYNRWMTKFPTITALSEADIEEVNALWKGLGYYSRASRLLAGAQKVVRDLGGFLPDNAKDMESKIPGIGRYSAGAICSIAYGEKVPVLDGNVHRLMSRFLMLYANPKSKATLDILWAAAEEMVDVKGSSENPGYQNPGDINQALIELGSTICKVQNPTCSSCPLSEWCEAYQKQFTVEDQKASEEIGDIEDLCSLCEPLPPVFDVAMLPMKAEKKKAREETDMVYVVEWRLASGSNDRWFLLVKRPEKGLLAGLYEFPTIGNVSEPDSKQQYLSATLELLSNMFASPIRHLDTSITAARSPKDGAAIDSEVRISQVKPAGDVLHLFSHVKKTYRSQWLVLEGGSSPPALIAKPKAVLPREKAAKGKRKAEPSPESNVGITSSGDVRWVTLEEVDQQNISTGMVKVWNLTKLLWERE